MNTTRSGLQWMLLATFLVFPFVAGVGHAQGAGRSVAPRHVRAPARSIARRLSAWSEHRRTVRNETNRLSHVLETEHRNGAIVIAALPQGPLRTRMIAHLGRYLERRVERLGRDRNGQPLITEWRERHRYWDGLLSDFFLLFVDHAGDLRSSRGSPPPALRYSLDEYHAMGAFRVLRSLMQEHPTYRVPELSRNLAGLAELILRAGDSITAGWLIEAAIDSERGYRRPVTTDLETRARNLANRMETDPETGERLRALARGGSWLFLRRMDRK